MAVRDMERQSEILEARFAGLTYAQIARKLGISRQRVQQLISPPPWVRSIVVNRAGGNCQDCGLLVNGSGHVHHKACDGEDYNDVANLVLLCVSCHRIAHVGVRSICLQCGQPTNGLRRYFCSKKCWSLYHKTTMTCSSCGKEYELQTSQASARIKRNESGKYFCSKECQGKHTGRNYGFVKHPKNIGPHKISKFKPMAPEIVERLDKGEKLYKIASDIGWRSGNLSTLKRLVIEERKLKGEQNHGTGEINTD